jgi:hypothetical protein
VGGGGCRESVEGEYCVHMYVNEKMRSIETIPGMGGERVKENDERGELKYDIFDIV